MATQVTAAAVANPKGVLAIGEAFERLGTSFCFDTETAMAPTSFGGRGFVRLLQFWSDDYAFWLDNLELGEEEWGVVAAMLQRTELEVTCQNAAYDYRVMAGCGVWLGGKPGPYHSPTLYDTMIASRLIYNGQAKLKHGLGDIVKRELKVVLDKSLQSSDWMTEELTPEKLAYAMGDVEWTWEVAKRLHEKVAAQGLEAVYRLECALVPATVEMESTGFAIDVDTLDDVIAQFSNDAGATRQCFLETLDGYLQGEGEPALPRDDDGAYNTRAKAVGSVRLGTKVLAGFNVNSPAQVLTQFALLGITPTDDAGKPTLDRKVMAKHQHHEVVRLYLSYKKVEKRLSMLKSLSEAADDDGRIRARFMPLATGTGRWSSSSPNLQQVPREAEIRGIFAAPLGRVFVDVDWSAMELRAAAAIVGEAAMLAAFADGADIHTRTASLMFGVAEDEVTKGQRQQAKACNFGLLYGSGPRGLLNYFATVGAFITLNQAGEFRELWLSAYPAFRRWHQECDQRAQRGEHMRTRAGRRRYLYGDDNRLTTQANGVVQGTCADIAKAALVEIHRRLPATARIVAIVHDEIIVEADAGDAEAVLAMMQREMAEAGVPLLGTAVTLSAEGGIGATWADAH